MEISTSMASSTLLNDLDKSGAQEEEIDVSVIERLVREEELNNKNRSANSSNEQNSEKESIVEDKEPAKKDEAQKMHRLSTFIVNPENLTQKPVEPEDQNREWFYCGDCGARFSTEEILEEHVVKHTGKY